MSEMEAIVGKLKQQRDELAVKIHLAGKDAQDEWDALEQKWNELNAEAKPVTDAAGETAKNVGSALDLVADELKAGYDRIRKALD